MRRVAVVSFVHEAHSFAAPTALGALERSDGEGFAAAHRGAGTTVGGFLDALGDAAVPVYEAVAHPGGPIDAPAWEQLRRELDAALARMGAVDAVALALHGAPLAHGCEDPDLEVVRAVRAAADPDAPCVAVFDLHGNVSRATLDALDAALPVRRYPHDDFHDRGVEAIARLREIAARGVAPATLARKLPLLLAPTTTTQGLGAELVARCADAVQRTGLADCAVFHGFPYADDPRVGVQVLGTSWDPGPAERRAVDEVAQWIWDQRAALTAPGLDAPAAVAETQRRAGDGLVVLADSADNPGGGGPGDGTHVLHALRAAGVRDVCVAAIRDPETAAAAHAAGVGARIDVTLGAKTDALHGEPVRDTATVVALGSGRVALEAVIPGFEVEYGPSALLRVGEVDVVVSSLPGQILDTTLLAQLGAEPARYGVLSVKSSHHFRTAFEPLAATIVTAAAGPGLVTSDVGRFPRERTPRPIHPLDPDTSWEAAA